MINDPINFLHSMCRYAVIAAAALSPAIAVSYAGVNPVGAKPFNLWINDANEADVADPYGVVRIYSGKREAINPKPLISVQLAVYGKSNVQSHYLANGLFRGFCLDPFELPRRMVTVSGFNIADNSVDSLGNWMLVNADVQMPPSHLQTDDRGRVKIVSNFDLGFLRIQS